jgi:tetratricopeptide (TPR) repeat protein
VSDMCPSVDNLPYTSDESLSDFALVVSYRFQKHIKEVREQRKRREVFECVLDLMTDQQNWLRRNVRRVNSGNRKAIRSARINDVDRLVFEGPLESETDSRPIVFVHDFGNHSDVDHIIRRALRILPQDEQATDIIFDEETNQIQAASLTELPAEQIAFSKPIRSLALADADIIDKILTSDRANISLTKIQRDILSSRRPLLISGQAGTGKTTILCHRVAASIIDQRRLSSADPILYLSYSGKLVEQAEDDVKEILRFVYLEDEEMPTCEFIALQEFLKRYVVDESRFKDALHMSFGKFKLYYEPYKQGSPSTRRISPELAWHVIRSVMKGACLPPDKPPLTRVRYEKLSRERQEVTPDLYEDLYRIGQWYQNLIKDKGMWDDEDLAWTALAWIIQEQNRNPGMRLYSEIFCDEVQDLTELEFAVLRSLCRPPVAFAQEGLPLALAGDPLQTINPTGFRWEVISQHVYQIDKQPVQRHELHENWRSDHRIVSFANQVQSLRAAYLKNELETQLGFEREGEGDTPNLITIGSRDEEYEIAELIRKLPDRSAVIIWDEEDDEVEKLLSQDPVISQLAKSSAGDYLAKRMAELNVYRVSEAKGLEFRRVILYKLGEHPDVRRWWSLPDIKESQDLQTQIPLLYFLNRLYISITRAQSYLFIIDSPEAIENFWGRWQEWLRTVPRDDVSTYVRNHVAFQETPDWREWGDSLFEMAERRQDVQDYERARSAYQKADVENKVKRVDARIAELREQWTTAGDLYFELNDYKRAAACFQQAKAWKKAALAWNELPDSLERNRWLAICRFKGGSANPSERRKAALEFFDGFRDDKAVPREYRYELANILNLEKEYLRAGKIYSELGQEFSDLHATEKAGKCYCQGKQYEMALTAFRISGYNKTEYIRSLEEVAAAAETRGDLDHAAELFGELAQHIDEGARRQGLCLFALGRFGDALAAFQQAGYSGKEYDLSKAEDKLSRGEIDEAVELLSKHEAHQRILSIVSSPYEPQLIPYVARAFRRTGQYPQAIETYKIMAERARDIGNFPQLNKALERVAECQEAIGEDEHAYRNYKNARAYDRALILGNKLNKPESERLELEIESARRNSDFDLAIELARKLGDEQRVDSLTGHKMKYLKRPGDAVDYFVKSKDWHEAINCIDNTIFASDGARLQNRLKILKAAGKIHTSLRNDEKQKAKSWLEEIEEDEWIGYITEPEVGLAKEKFGTFGEAKTFYESHQKAEWARRGWLRVREAQAQFHDNKAESEKAASIRANITKRRHDWRM